MNWLLDPAWMNWRRGVRWWPAKLGWGLLWIAIANLIAGGVGVAIWVVVALVRGHF